MDVMANFNGVSTRVMAHGEVDFETNAMELHVSALGETITYVQTSGVVYARVGSLVSGQYPGKSWVQMPLSAFASGRRDTLLITNDPQKMMTALVRLGSTVTAVGPATVDGTQDEKYKIRLTVADLESHAFELPPSIRSLFATAQSVPTTAHVSTTMYVDAAGQLQATHLVVTAEATGHPVSGSIDLTMSKFGTATVPAAPPAAQTVTYRQLKGPLFTSSGRK